VGVSVRFDFRDRTVLVTGAAQGIGSEICSVFAAAGAHVWGSDLDASALARATERITRSLGEGEGSGSFRARVVDVTDGDAVEGWIEGALSEAGRIDVLVHVAGGVGGQVGRPVEEVTREEWDALLATNLTGAFLAARAVAPSMRGAGSGRIVIISSGAALRVSLTGLHAYAAAKSGQLGLVRQLAHELGRDGITVNAVAPGFVRSNPTTERQWDSYGGEGQEALVRGIAVRRLGEPADIAHAVAFLASDEAGWITGQTLQVDGGR
jgi:3-oxoacyl-[acyl-carrier protein] reductase